ncbi:hypothetical protein CYMTET_22503 [Cymbomonas tetramitiformis]|uniref:Protein yippee-like n=1 Tax=Cymbomonas tetramitiformis TaxID=36881 RepID=A0AAE0L1U8_9CHLO|nr:hypothetical protein CYMTET_22503 [Cymbomonas tetramitiformis]
MGRIYREFVEDGSSKYCCEQCSADVASSSAVIWEGYMGKQKPAVLVRDLVNVEAYAEARQERLSTGDYTLVDVWCRCCANPLGWKYLHATTPEQKYKEGAALLDQAKLVRSSCEE